MSETNRPEIKIGGRKIIRVAGVFGPAWAIYPKSSGEAVYYGSEHAAIKVAKMMHINDITERAGKLNLNPRLVEAFFDVRDN